MLGSYLFNKKNGLDMVSELSEGSPDYVPVHGGEYIGGGGRIKIRAQFGQFILDKDIFLFLFL